MRGANQCKASHAVLLIFLILLFLLILLDPADPPVPLNPPGSSVPMVGRPNRSRRTTSLTRITRKTKTINITSSCLTSLNSITAPYDNNMISSELPIEALQPVSTREVLDVPCQSRLMACSFARAVHECPHCGLVLDRDLNAARNILEIGREPSEYMPVGEGTTIQPQFVGQVSSMNQEVSLLVGR